MSVDVDVKTHPRNIPPPTPPYPPNTHPPHPHSYTPRPPSAPHAHPLPHPPPPHFAVPHPPAPHHPSPHNARGLPEPRHQSIEHHSSARQSPGTPAHPHHPDHKPPPPRMSGPPGEAWAQPTHPPHHQQQPHPESMQDLQYAAPQYHHDPYGPPRRYSHHEAQTPVAGYMPQQQQQQHETPFTHYAQEPEATHLRRKAVRAAQACENCRQKKSKCDETRPECSSCIQSNLKCQYREVPPPKQEKSMQQVTDILSTLVQKVDQLQASFDSRLSRLEDSSSRAPALSTSPGSAALQSSTNGILSPPSGPGWANSLNNGVSFKQESEDMKRSASASASVSAIGMAPSRSGMGEQGDLGSVGNVHKLTKPPDLDTQAHNLLWKWKSIRPFVQNILKNPDEDYVLAAEESRGVLKLFGAAPSHHRSAEGPTVDSPAAASDFSDSGTSGESWGQAGSRICNFSPVDKYTETLPGGYNSRTGYIQLDRQTIERLYHSYLEHLHVLHPFINQDRVNHTIDKIFAHHSMFAVPDSASSSFDMRREASSGQKRKWGDQDATSNGKSTPRGNNSNNSPYPPPAKLERSPDMAILLLICALGRVCEEKGDLNVSSFNMTDYYTDSGAPSPLAGMSSPAGNTPRSASFPSVNSLSKERKNRTPMNVDTHPGLVYYAEAKEILGNMTGNHSMAFVHANLLAGLYMAQFVRILESYRSIHDACVSCIILINQLAGKDPQKIQDNYVRLTFWSCLQMESDILAELSFPKSGITEYEDKFPLPDTGDQKVMLCYSAQITLRKILNRSTWYLFDGNHPLLNNPKRSLDQLEDMVGYLDGWRQVTASLATSHGIPELAWEDSDEPATDINIARMRGKYYGAKYIIHRPFLKHILHQEEFNKTAEQGAATYGTPQAGLGQTESEDYARIVAHANTCVNAAIQSTYAFDGYRKQYGRLLVTNIFGTAHAQFGNTLVLSATSRSRNYHWMVKKHQLENLLIRTIEFFKPLAKLSSTMLNDLKILYNTKRILNAEDEARHTGTFTNSHAMSASHSFQGSAPSSMSQSFPP